MESGGLKAIETAYNGYLFRSRLEARWALFFDSIHIPYQYEPEGFDLGGGLYYLPDFYLPHLDCFFEVKGPFTNNKGREKAIGLCGASNKIVYLFGDLRNPGEGDGIAFFPQGGEDIYYEWCRKKCCGKFGIEFAGRSSRVICDCTPERKAIAYANDHPDKGYNYKETVLNFAFFAARKHRFDKEGK